MCCEHTENWRERQPERKWLTEPGKQETFVASARLGQLLLVALSPSHSLSLIDRGTQVTRTYTFFSYVSLKQLTVTATVDRQWHDHTAINQQQEQPIVPCNLTRYSSLLVSVFSASLLVSSMYVYYWLVFSFHPLLLVTFIFLLLLYFKCWNVRSFNESIAESTVHKFWPVNQSSYLWTSNVRVTLCTSVNFICKHLR